LTAPLPEMLIVVVSPEAEPAAEAVASVVDVEITFPPGPVTVVVTAPDPETVIVVVSPVDLPGEAAGADEADAVPEPAVVEV